MGRGMSTLKCIIHYGMQVSSTFVLVYLLRSGQFTENVMTSNITFGETRTQKMKQHSYCLGKS